MKPSLGADLASRFAVSSKEHIEKRKKKDPKNRTMTCSGTTAMYNAVGKLATKLDLSRSHVIELALKELCAKHEVQIGGDDE